MSLHRILIEPLGPLFLGTQGRVRKSGAAVHSDTLHAALVDVAALAGSPLVDAAERLRVSSLFPFWKSVYFYPKPFLPPPGAMDGAATTDRKRWKSVTLVSGALLDAWLAGDAATVNHAEIHADGIALLPEDRQNRGAFPDRIFLRDMTPGVTVDRLNTGATPYERRMLRINTRSGCGLYFLADLDDTLLPEFRTVLERLGEHGLGGERSVGHGHFTVLEVSPVSDGPGIARDGATHFISLSLYLPTREEVAAGVLQGACAYDCAVRGGWVHDKTGSAERKRSVRMCVEGSVFPVVPGALGEVRDCRAASFTAHPIWRSGLALPVYFRNGERTS